MTPNPTPTATSYPTLTVNSPVEGGVYQPGAVTMSIDVGDFISSGQGHIHYNLDSTGVVMKYDTTDVVFDIPDDGEHILEVSLVNTEHEELDPPVRETITFTIAGPTPQPTSTPQPTPTATVDTANTIFVHIPN